MVIKTETARMMKAKIGASKNDDMLYIPPIFKSLLRKRGVEGEDNIRKFLYPQLTDLPLPGEMKNLVEAVHLILRYMNLRNQIIIWGDYDVDGTTGTALLVNFFDDLGVNVLWHIPNRMTEGYGLNIEWFTANKKSFSTRDFLLITVDCGISDGKQVEKIKKMGGEVVVTDHHNIPESGIIPDCLILNPSQPSCGFHLEQLAGVGVAFYLAAGIRAEFARMSGAGIDATKINLKNYLALVALGTIADVVELTATNRILVRAGLEVLGNTSFPGLQELLSSCDVNEGTIFTEDIGYLIGPKINAAGRLGESDLVVKILTEKDRKKAKRLVEKLTEFNEKRRKISAENLETALTVAAKGKIEIEKCVIVYGEFHQGVAGIVASRLVEIFGVPSIVFAEKIFPDGSKHYVGSARSIAGVNILKMITVCSRWLSRYGGHEMAAGLSLEEGNFLGFQKDFACIAREVWNDRSLTQKTRFDIECSVEDLMTDENMSFFKLFEPFGPGNLQPIFQDNSARIVDSKTVGKCSEHLNLTIRGKYSNLKGIGFSLGSRIIDVQREPERRILYVPTVNRFRGNVSWQVRVIDL